MCLVAHFFHIIFRFCYIFVAFLQKHNFKTMLHLVPREQVDRAQIMKKMIATLNEANKAGNEKSAPVTKKKSQKVGRNDPCPCGSGKKYKNCCGKK